MGLPVMDVPPYVGCLLARMVRDSSSAAAAASVSISHCGRANALTKMRTVAALSFLRTRVGVQFLQPNMGARDV